MNRGEAANTSCGDQNFLLITNFFQIHVALIIYMIHNNVKLQTCHYNLGLQFKSSNFFPFSFNVQNKNVTNFHVHHGNLFFLNLKIF